MRRLVIIIVCALASGWLVRRYVFEVIEVESASMEPTLPVGIHYLVEKISYQFHSPHRGDIVELTSPMDHQLGMIKRVIAVEGDHLQIRSKQVYLNGILVQEPYAVHHRASEELVGDNIGPLDVPSGHAFVLGDNRDESEDSSVWTNPKTGEHLYFVPYSDIQGRLIQLP